MRILRGTFRLSVVVAVLVAAYSAFITYQKSADYRAQQLREYFDVKFAYQCAARQTDENLRPFVNDYGLIDLIKAGCTEQKMVASFDELKQWRDGTPSWHEPDERDMPALFDGYATFLWLVLAFVAVNLIGLLVVGIKNVSRWVVAGFRPSRT
jgi:hypothetical protein